VTVLRIRGVALPDGDPVDLFADGDRWTDDPVPGAELAAEGWLVPGLVDAHTHPGAEEPGGSLTPGSRADAVVYDADPRTDLALLDAPRAVILRGRLVHHRAAG